MGVLEERRKASLVSRSSNLASLLAGGISRAALADIGRKGGETARYPQTCWRAGRWLGNTNGRPFYPDQPHIRCGTSATRNFGVHTRRGLVVSWLRNCYAKTQAAVGATAVVRNQPASFPKPKQHTSLCQSEKKNTHDKKTNARQAISSSP